MTSRTCDREDAAALDASDPLASFRERFLAPDPSLIYLDGNSLGRPPRSALTLANDLVANQWADRLIRRWNEGWFMLPEMLGADIAGLVGAGDDEVLVADSTSVNLFKLVVAALRLAPSRSVVLSDDLNFPSDLYVIQSAVNLIGGGRSLRIAPSNDGIHGPVGALTAMCQNDVALAVLSHTVFKSGYTYDMAAVTAAMHDRGALVLWDLSHSAGAVPVDLNGAGVDLAVGCTYKHLNGGPGAPAFLYVRRELQERLENPLAGWMGHAAPFQFDLGYRPLAGIRRFLTGTPQVASLALIQPGVQLLREAGMEAVRAKSVRQTEYVITLFDEILAPAGFTLKSPRDPDRRGAHVAIGHAEALAIDLALIYDYGILPDYRAPDNIRLGLAPLYTTFTEIYNTVMALAEIVKTRSYARHADSTPQVT